MRHAQARRLRSPGSPGAQPSARVVSIAAAVAPPLLLLRELLLVHLIDPLRLTRYIVADTPLLIILSSAYPEIVLPHPSPDATVSRYLTLCPGEELDVFSMSCHSIPHA